MQDTTLVIGYVTLALGYMLLGISHVVKPAREHASIQFTLGIGCAILVFGYLTAMSGTHVLAPLEPSCSLDASDDDSEGGAEPAPTGTSPEVMIYVNVNGGHVSVRVPP